MIQKLFLSFVSDIVKSLGNDFFSKSTNEKQNIIKNLEFDASDLVNIENDNSLIELTKNGLLALETKSSLDYQNNLLLFAFVNYLRGKIIPLYDRISTAFFIAKITEKKLVLDKILSDNSTFTQLFSLFLQKATNEETQSLLLNIFKRSNPSGDSVIVQSARECSPQLKAEIRTKYGENSFVVFQVNTRLLGGLLIYKNGKISDTSWLGKISALKQLNNIY